MVREASREEQQREAELWREQPLHDQREARGLIAALMTRLPQQLARAVLAFAETDGGKLVGYALYDFRRVRATTNASLHHPRASTASIHVGTEVKQ
jgi:hypothetical protein